MFFIIRLLINAVALWAASRIVPDSMAIGPQNYIVTLLVVALIFGLVNAVIKPIVASLTCPLYILTLGLFTFVVNALMLYVTSFIASLVGLPFSATGNFIQVLLAAIVISVVSFVLSLILREESAG